MFNCLEKFLSSDSDYDGDKVTMEGIWIVTT